MTISIHAQNNSGERRVDADRRALLLGHFSTVGDIQCLEIVKDVLNAESIPFDVAPFGENVRNAMHGTIAPPAAEPRNYSHLLVICGPCSPGFFRKYRFDVDAFEHCTRIGINLTMLEPLDTWNPFDVLLERDSSKQARPDLAFLMRINPVHVLGRCTIKSQKEYGSRQLHDRALANIDALIARRGLPVIDINTRWPASLPIDGLQASDAVSALISRVDVLITNRLHGLVFALRNGVPALAIDAVAGGDKVSAQARVLDWPICLDAETLSVERLETALDWCLTTEARDTALRVQQRALEHLADYRQQISTAMDQPVVRNRNSRPPPKWAKLVHALKGFSR